MNPSKFDTEDLFYLNLVRKNRVTRNGFCWFLKRKYDVLWDEAVFLMDLCLDEDVKEEVAV